jgi:hypothetical protein
MVIRAAVNDAPTYWLARHDRTTLSGPTSARHPAGSSVLRWTTASSTVASCRYSTMGDRTGEHDLAGGLSPHPPSLHLQGLPRLPEPVVPPLGAARRAGGPVGRDCAGKAPSHSLQERSACTCRAACEPLVASGKASAVDRATGALRGSQHRWWHHGPCRRPQLTLPRERRRGLAKPPTRPGSPGWPGFRPRPRCPITLGH